MNKSLNSNRQTSKRRLIQDISLTTLGLELALPIFGGVLFGYYLDKVMPTKYLYTMVFLLIGLVVGYYNIYKLIQLEMYRLRLHNDRSGEDGT